MQRNILEYLEATAKRLPDKIAYSDGKDNLSFSSLLNDSRAIGSALCQKGYAKEPIAILMNRHPSQIAAFYGVVYAGCFYIPLDADMPPERMELILQSTQARAMITDAKGRKIVDKLSFSGEILSYERLCEGAIDEISLNAVREKQIDTDPIYIVFTSGSTGIPKGVAACHRSVIDYTESLCDALGFSEETVFGNQTPLFFDAPLKELMPTIKFGATTYLSPKSLFLFPMRLCDFLNENRINTVCWVVSALTMISTLGVLEKNPPKYLTTVAFGSEVFPRKQYDLWREALPNARFFNLYGPTEATGMSTYWNADRSLEDGEAIPIGKPFQNTDLMLVNEEGRLALDGEKGEIYLRGTCVTLGYYNNPEKTAEAFVQNPLQSYYPELVYRTGDIAYRNAHGELVFVCRKDSQIKHMGHRIELGEIESAALKIEGVEAVCCLYEADNKRIALFYVGKTEKEDLLERIKAYLPRYMLPALCEKLDRMPLTPNGKKDRKALAARFFV